MAVATWLLLAAASFLVAPHAHATDMLIDAIIVKWRDTDSASVTLSGARIQQIGTALQDGFTPSGRTTTGAFKLRLAHALSVDQARAALNRLRLAPDILYASFAPAAPPTAAERSAVKSLAATRATNRLIVKYTDSARTAAALAGIPPDRSELDRLSGFAGTPLAFVRPMHDGANVLRMMRALPLEEVEAIAAQIAQQPGVAFAQPDYIDHIALAPNDACYPSNTLSQCRNGYQWDLFDPAGGINAPAAWDITTGSAGIVIGVIDTGALFNHPDLSGRFLPGYDMIDDALVANDNDPNPMCNENTAVGCFGSRDANAADPGDWLTQSQVTVQSDWFFGCFNEGSSFHGSHVAGTIGASANNSIGTSGINWVSKILPVRALGRCGGYGSDIADGIVWASGGNVPGVPANSNPARVLNLSVGGFRPNKSCDGVYQVAIDGALVRNTVIAVAAGNENYDSAWDAPGNCAGVITVAATGQLGYKAFYSNFGAQVEIAAPGGDSRVTAFNPKGLGILSTINAGVPVAIQTSPTTIIGGSSPDPNGYIYTQYQGTSMATPHVAGVVSLMLSANSSLTPAQVISKLQSSAKTFASAAPACDTSNDPVAHPVSSSLWFACTCTTALCGAGLIDAGRAVAAAIGNVSTITLASSANPSTAGSSVSFTASVTGIAPTGTVGFTDNGSTIGGCAAVTLTGAGAVRTAVCATAALTPGTHAVVAAYTGDGSNSAATSAPLSQVVGGGSETNVALASNGGSVAVSSVPSTSAAPYIFGAAALNDGERAGVHYGTSVAGGGWQDATYNQYPDWVQLNFNQSYLVDRVVVYSLQDNFPNPVDPSATMTFSLFGVTDFSVQSWNGASWVTLATVTGNNLVKRTVTFAPVATASIRVVTTGALNGFSRLTEVEAWAGGAGGGGGAPAETNWALASNGGNVLVTSTPNINVAPYIFGAAALNDGEHAGIHYGTSVAGGGWQDATYNIYPDAIQLDLNGAHAIDRVVLYTLQDNFTSPVEPTDTTTFSLFGITGFYVQGWTGTSWTTLATVTGNNLVKRTVTFAPFTTTNVRVYLTGALNGFSRLVEVEAWGN